MYKIAVIGDSESVLGFMAVGFTVFDVTGASEAASTLKKIAAQDYAVIFIVETLAEEISETVAQYKAQPIPAVITIPGKDGATGYGMNAIKKSVERAVGADIL